MAQHLDQETSQARPPDEHLRALLGSLADGVFMVDSAGRVAVWNQPLEDLVDLPAADILGQHYSAILDSFLPLTDDPHTMGEDFQRALERIADQPVLMWTIRQPQARLLQVRLFPVAADSGGRAGWGGVVRDLTRVDETGALATVLHELRTPLAAIKGYVTSLLDNFERWEPSAVQEFLATVNESADQLSGLVENMLDMSRLEGGTLRLQRRSLSLPDLVGRIVEEIELNAPQHSFAARFPPDFPGLRADRLRLEQVLSNLLQNAVKYSPQGGEINISGEAEAGQLTVRVQDSGIGVPAEERERIFERFYQASNAQTAQASGAGLGLYICRRIIEAHGGQIWVEPPPSGPGSIFSFRIPFEPTALPVLEGPAEPEPEQRPRSHVRILVVEDDKRLVRFVKANLESSGYEVLTVFEGEAALDIVERDQPDLILLDLMLPKLDGYTICARVREFSAVPIIILTARADEADLVRGLDLGADDYLVKPFGTKELLARVRAVLRRSQFPDEVQAQPALVRGELTIDFGRREVTVGGQQVSLTPTEYKLLYHLARNAGQVLTHEQLLRRVWGPAYETESAYLWVYVSRLRKKIEPDTENPRHILSEPGIGYRFAG